MAGLRRLAIPGVVVRAGGPAGPGRVGDALTASAAVMGSSRRPVAPATGRYGPNPDLSGITRTAVE
jgi:hypothetical protein